MRLAIVKDFLPRMRGAERVLDLWCRTWPDADLYALFHNRGALTPAIEGRRIRTSFLQHAPGIATRYPYYLPLMPLAIGSLRPARYDLVLSMSQCVAKGVRLPPGVPHLCYCLTPMRYVWDMAPLYFPSRLAVPLIGLLRSWDRRTSGRPDGYLAISTAVAERIRRLYGRPSEVVHPPADETFFTPDPGVPREDFYLVASALVPYKRIDLAVEACRLTSRRLVVIGTGPEEASLKRRAGPETTFLGWQPDPVLRDHYRRCRALLFPGEEDFGIVMAEALLCGAPVIAYDEGGARDIVGDPGSGILFRPQTSEALMGAIERAEGTVFSAADLRARGERFSSARHVQQIRRQVESYAGEGRL